MGAYYKIIQSNSINEEAKAVSRILIEFDELEEAGFSVESDQQMFLYRLYELSCNKKVDIKSLIASDFKKLTNYTDWLGKVGTVANFAENIGYVGNALSALADGNIKGATDELANWIGGATSGFIAQSIEL